MLVSDRKRTSTFSIDSIMAAEPPKRRALPSLPDSLRVSPPISTQFSISIGSPSPPLHPIPHQPPHQPVNVVASKMFYDGLMSTSPSSLVAPGYIHTPAQAQSIPTDLERIAQYPFYSWFLSRQEQFNSHQLHGYHHTLLLIITLVYIN